MNKLTGQAWEWVSYMNLPSVKYRVRDFEQYMDEVILMIESKIVFEEMEWEVS